MVKNVNVALNDADYQQIVEVKDDLGLTWEEFVIEAAECLEKHSGED